jgi:Cu/Ag efflux protein CusF
LLSHRSDGAAIRTTSLFPPPIRIKEYMKGKALGFIAGALIAAAPLVSSAAGLPAPFEGSSTLQADGVVKSVDQANHSVTVLDAQGGEASFNITDTRNLAQIKQGGKVHIRMMRNAVISITQGVDGQAAAAHVAQSNTVQSVTAHVEAIDHASGIMALKGPNGSVFHIQGRDPAKITGVTPGMQVVVAFAPQVSVAVAPAQ